MKKFKPVTRIIDDRFAPQRLQGRAVVITLDTTNHQLQFKVDLPDDANEVELNYLRTSIDGFVNELRSIEGVGHLLKEKTRDEVVRNDDSPLRN